MQFEITPSMQAIAILVDRRAELFREFRSCEDQAQRERLFALWNCMRRAIEHVQSISPRPAKKRPVSVRKTVFLSRAVTSK